MSPSRAPLARRRPSLVLGLAVAASLAAPSFAGAAAFGGGGTTPATGTTRAFAVVTVGSNGSTTPVAVTAESRRCSTGGPQIVRARDGSSGGVVGPIVGARTVRPRFGARRGRVRITVDLRPGSRGPYAGTVTLVGTLPAGRRGTVRCRASIPVQVRPAVGVAPAITSPTAPRYGQTRQSVTFPGGRARQPGAIVLHPDVPALGGTARTITAFWSARERCVTRGRGAAFDALYVAVTARLRPDGSFRGTFRRTEKRGTRGYRASFLVTGRIGPDGAVRGSVRATERYTRKRYYPVVCRTPTTKYVASP